MKTMNPTEALMRFTLPTIIFMFCVITVASQQNETASDPSLGETTTWIREKLLTHSTVTSDVSAASVSARASRKLEDVKFEGCTMKVRDVVDGESGGTLHVHITMNHTLSLSDLDPNTVSVTKTQSGKNVALKVFTVGGLKRITTDMETEIVELAQSKSKSTLTDGELSFSVTDQDMGERIAKAIRHAVSLCRKQKEPF